MRVLITGSSGFIGTRLVRALEDAGHTPVTTTRNRALSDSAFLDLTDTPSIAPVLDAAQPDAIIHAAAIRDLWACEKDPELAQRVNTDSTRAIADWARARGSRLVSLSTDQVFDGARGMYKEADARSPINVYGRTKCEAEDATLTAGPLGTVVRLALTMGHTKEGNRAPNEFIVNLLRAGRSVPLFENEYRNPILVEEAAAALVEVLGLGPLPILHVGGPERVSRMQMGLALARAFEFDEHLCTPARYSEAASGLRRAADPTLDVSLSERILRSRPSDFSTLARRLADSAPIL